MAGCKAPEACGRGCKQGAVHGGAYTPEMAPVPAEGSRSGLSGNQLHVIRQCESLNY